MSAATTSSKGGQKKLTNNASSVKRTLVRTFLCKNQERKESHKFSASLLFVLCCVSSSLLFCFCSILFWFFFFFFPLCFSSLLLPHTSEGEGDLVVAGSEAKDARVPSAQRRIHNRKSKVGKIRRLAKRKVRKQTETKTESCSLKDWAFDSLSFTLSFSSSSIRLPIVVLSEGGHLICADVKITIGSVCRGLIHYNKHLVHTSSNIDRIAVKKKIKIK